jgi:type 1 fimbria pilin
MRPRVPIAPNLFDKLMLPIFGLSFQTPRIATIVPFDRKTGVGMRIKDLDAQSRTPGSAKPDATTSSEIASQIVNNNAWGDFLAWTVTS